MGSSLYGSDIRVGGFFGKVEFVGVVGVGRVGIAGLCLSFIFGYREFFRVVRGFVEGLLYFVVRWVVLDIGIYKCGISIGYVVGFCLI